MHILKVMSDPPNTMKKREKLQSNGQQKEKSYSQDVVGMDIELSQRGSEVPKDQALERKLHVFNRPQLY